MKVRGVPLDVYIQPQLELRLWLESFFERFGSGRGSDFVDLVVGQAKQLSEGVTLVNVGIDPRGEQL